MRIGEFFRPDKKTLVFFVIFAFILFLFTPVVVLVESTPICTQNFPSSLCGNINMYGESILLLSFLGGYQFDNLSLIYSVFNVVVSYILASFVSRRSSSPKPNSAAM